jgi:hypothetical protein
VQSALERSNTNPNMSTRDGEPAGGGRSRSSSELPSPQCGRAAPPSSRASERHDDKPPAAAERSFTRHGGNLLTRALLARTAARHRARSAADAEDSARRSAAPDAADADARDDHPTDVASPTRPALSVTVGDEHGGAYDPLVGLKMNTLGAVSPAGLEPDASPISC